MKRRAISEIVERLTTPRPEGEPSFRERGKAKAEARHAAGFGRVQARARRKLEAARLLKWERLEAIFRRAGEHGRATRERLLEFVTDAPSVEQGERVLLLVTAWALDQADPVGALNQQLNEAERARDARPNIDPSWTEGKAAE